MERTLTSRVAVITGASSGIGRAAAIEFARRGAFTVLAARRVDALEATARACRDAGSDALVVATDVTRESDVKHLAEAALHARGKIDVWVNNAGVTCFGRLEATPFEPHQRVLQTNVHGAMFGARAVVPIFQRQGRGVLINVGSVLSKVGQPFVPSYVVSKFALRGLSEALRTELANYPRIHVCTLMPYAVDTPHFQAGANFVGREAHPMPPVQAPEKVAVALVDLATNPQRDRYVPRTAELGLALHALFPRFVEQAIHDALSTWHFGLPQPMDASGNLWHPEPAGGEVHGRRRPRLRSTGLAGWFVRWLFASHGPKLAPRLGGP
jgi:NAD(P)-dependent dehydrogenase (short-subunit alcohol dehydrogenase family)